MRKRQARARRIVTEIHLEEGLRLGDKAGMGLFSLGRRKEAAVSESSKRIAGAVREALKLGEEDAVTVSQIDCGDPACEGGAETFILVMRKGERTKAVKISKAMRLVSDEDVAKALATLS
jgi:methyl coenzyme M reductase beta subunit